MKRIAISAALGLALFVVLIAGSAVFEHGHGVQVSAFRPIGPAPGPIKNVRYECADQRSFALSINANGHATFGDGTNGLGFNVKNAYLTPFRVFGDGTLVVGTVAGGGFVLVNGQPYMTQCTLRTHSYHCDDGKSFGIDVQGAGEEQIVFTDGTNRKFFTVYRQPVPSGRLYSDSVIDLTLGWTDATVAVAGKPYMTNCNLDW